MGNDDEWRATNHTSSMSRWPTLNCGMARGHTRTPTICGAGASGLTSIVRRSLSTCMGTHAGLRSAAAVDSQHQVASGMYGENTHYAAFLPTLGIHVPSAVHTLQPQLLSAGV